MKPTRGLLRGLRAVSLGVVGLNLALVAHLTAGGAAPGPAALLLLAGLMGLAAVLLTGARLSPFHIGISLSAMQVILHEAFLRLGSQAVCTMTEVRAPGGMRMGHGVQPMVVCATDMAHAGMGHAGMGHGSVVAASAMVGAHVVATAVMIALLAYGEQVLWFLAGCVRPARWLRPVQPDLPPARVAASDAPRMLRARFASGGVGRRGPPTRIPLAAA
jgi:hypothetical protein